jgi:hypothetical protein
VSDVPDRVAAQFARFFREDQLNNDNRICWAGFAVPARNEMVQEKINWTFWVDQIRAGMCTPLVGDTINREFLFGDQDVVTTWATEMGYPLPDKDNLAHVAHYLSVIESDQLLAKRAYLRHLVQSVQRHAGGDQANGATMPPAGSTSGDGTSVSDIALRLGIANFTSRPDNPFFILANLPIKVYLTTGFHTLLEQALTTLGRQPVSDFYRWNDDLPQQSKSDQAAYSHEPTIERPLVYHLHGLDHLPESLVLTEENYLEFYERASDDITQQDGFPISVRNALTKSSLMLLGYSLKSWPFRVIFRGPIRALFTLKRPLSLAIQLDPTKATDISDQEQFRNYVRNYFSEYRFSMYWGSTAEFMSELWRNWEKA